MMKFYRLALIASCLLCFYSKVQAATLSNVTLMETSSSGKSIVLNQGLLEHYTEGTYAKFFVQRGELDFPKIFLVAEGRLVKSFPRKSYWYLSKIYIPNQIQKESHLLVLNSNQVKKGRTLTTSQRHIVLSGNDYQSADDYLDKNQNNVPDKLIQELDTYEASAELYEDKKNAEADLLVETYEGFKKTSGQHMSDEYNDESEEKYFIGPKPAKLADLKNAEDKKLLDSLSEGYVYKVNSQKFGLTNGLYKNQKMVPGQHEINDQISVASVYDEAREKRKQKEIVDASAIARIKRDGQAWSQDMDESSLRSYFIRTGMEQEQRRRELALSELDGNEILFHYTGSLREQSTDVDQNYRNLGYTLGLGYDLHLSRTNKDFKNWSLQFLLEKGVSDFDIGGKNGRGEEGSYGGYLNYYFFNNPLTLNSLILLGGLGMKAGSINMTSSSLSKDYTYQVLTLPSVQLMGKYRFRSGDLTEDTVNVGASFNAGVVYDRKRLSVVESLSDNIDGKKSINDIKYLIGLGIYF